MRILSASRNPTEVRFRRVEASPDEKRRRFVIHAGGRI